MALTATTRVHPDEEFMFTNGYQVLVTLASNPDFAFWEKEITPPSMSVGEAIDVTTQFAERYRMKVLRTLIEMGEVTLKGAYSKDTFVQADDQLGVDDVITLKFPTGHKFVFRGGLQAVEPDAQSEGDFPAATVKITITNRDPDTGEEDPPVMIDPT